MLFSTQQGYVHKLGKLPQTVANTSVSRPAEVILGEPQEFSNPGRTLRSLPEHLIRYFQFDLRFNGNNAWPPPKAIAHASFQRLVCSRNSGAPCLRLQCDVDKARAVYQGPSGSGKTSIPASPFCIRLRMNMPN
jgi:hypothetical protein